MALSRRAPLPAIGVRRRATLRAFAVPLVLLLCMTVPKIWQGDFNGDTGRYAAVGVQAWRSAAHGHVGALWTLMGRGGSEGVPYFNKPPLGLWIHGLVLWVFGLSLSAARAPSVAAAAMCVLATTDAARRACGLRVGMMSGSILALTYAFTGPTHAISLDTWQAALLMIAVDIAVMARLASRPLLVVWCGVPIGLALMTKPMVGLIAAPILGLWLAREGGMRWLGALGLATIVALLVAAPWHLSMVALHGSVFTDQYFGRQIGGRALGALGNANDDTSNPMYYARVLAEVYWPWLALIALAVVAAARREYARPDRRWVGLIAVWSVVWLVSLSMHPDKRPRYLLPLYPMWAWLIGLWLVRCTPAAVRRGTRRVMRWLPGAVAAVALLAAVLPVAVHDPVPPHWTALLGWMRDRHVSEIWEGGFDIEKSSRVYLETGFWPRVTRDLAGGRIADPPVGALLAYHRRIPWRPGPNETVEFRSEDGVLTVTRLRSTPWEPIPAGKPGDVAGSQSGEQ